MRQSAVLHLAPVLLALVSTTLAFNATAHRDKKQVSLFTVVQFPNSVCTTTSASDIYGTCLTSTECTSNGGAVSGNCASGFGVCCLISTSTCATTISQNNTYIKNPGFPSTYTPSQSGSCVFTINKVSDDVCQLRFDFQTFTGFTVTSTTTGACTDSFAVSGQTGKSSPTICSTNTGYHMYTEIGANSGDTSTVTLTYGGTTSKQFNIFVQQIECTSTSRAPTDCTQYYTGASGTIRSYGWGGSQLLAGMDYRICIRDEVGTCSITYSEESGTTIDAFALLAPPSAPATAGESTVGTCVSTNGLGLFVPEATLNGVDELAASQSLAGFPGAFCGGFFTVDGGTSAMALTSARKPFQLHLWVKSPVTLTAPATGFSLDYAQNPC